MKARVTPTKRDIERINEKIWKDVCEAQIDSNAVMLIAVKRHFKLGTKRIQQLCEYFNEVHREFDEYDRDGIFRKKVAEELEDVGIDTSELWDVPTTFAQETRNLKNQQKVNVSVSEARDIRNNFSGFKRLIGGQND